MPKPKYRGIAYVADGDAFAEVGRYEDTTIEKVGAGIYNHYAGIKCASVITRLEDDSVVRISTSYSLAEMDRLQAWLLGISLGAGAPESYGLLTSDQDYWNSHYILRFPQEMTPQQIVVMQSLAQQRFDTVDLMAVKERRLLPETERKAWGMGKRWFKMWYFVQKGAEILPCRNILI